MLEKNGRVLSFFQRYNNRALYVFFRFGQILFNFTRTLITLSLEKEIIVLEKSGILDPKICTNPVDSIRSTCPCCIWHDRQPTRRFRF